MADKAEKACTPSCSEIELLQRLEQAPVPTRKKLSKQISMSERPRNMLWERRRKQQRKKRSSHSYDVDNVTDEDLSELKGCIELGFGFNEEEGSQKLCNTLPALDLYFAVNRQFSMSPIQSPGIGSCPSLGASSSSLPESRSSSFISPSPRSSDSDSWKICSPGDHISIASQKHILFIKGSFCYETIVENPSPFIKQHQFSNWGMCPFQDHPSFWSEEGRDRWMTCYL